MVIVLHSKVSGSRLSLQVGTSGPSFGNRRTNDFEIKQDLLSWNQKMLNMINFFSATIIYCGFVRKSMFF